MIKLPKRLRILILALFFILLFSSLGVSLFLVRSRQDIRQRAAGNLIKAKVAMIQYGYLLTNEEMKSFADALGSLIYTATGSDISADVTVLDNITPPQLSPDEISSLRMDSKFAKISDKDLVFWKYYNSLNENSAFHRDLVNKVFAGQGYDLVVIVSNFQFPNPGYQSSYNSGKFIVVTNPYYFFPFDKKTIRPLPDIHQTLVHELGHALGANHPCNRCWPIDDPNSDNPKPLWTQADRQECCSKCQWKDDVMSYCAGHVSNYSLSFSACTIRRMESTQYGGPAGGTTCNEGTEYILESQLASPTPIPTNTDCKLDKEACLKAADKGCFWYKGYLGQFPDCRKGTVGDACGIESNCYAPDSTSNQVCYFNTYCANKGDLGFEAPCENSDQCPYGSSCKGNPLTCVRDATTPTPTPTPSSTNTCTTNDYFNYKCAGKTNGCSSLAGTWTESTDSSKSCGNDGMVCCWETSRQQKAPTCGEKFYGSVCRQDVKCPNGYAVNNPDGTSCKNEGSDYLCCGPKIEAGITTTPTSIPGVPTSTPRPLATSTPRPPTPTPTPAAPAISAVVATPCVNSDPGTIIFSWNREQSGYNYEIRWGNNYSESVTIGDRGQTDPISGFSKGVSLPFEVRSYLGNNIGPYKTGSVYIPTSCSSQGTSCPGGLNSCAGSDGSNLNCSGTKSYLDDGVLDSWCKNNGGAGSREYCWKCDTATKSSCDFNGNGSFDDGDIQVWSSELNQEQNGTTTARKSDCDKNGKIDIFDYNLWYEYKTGVKQ